MAFDFAEFFENGFLTDCELVLGGEDGAREVIRAHKMVLANYSRLFYNTFTSGMQESITGVVEILNNPMNLFPRVVRWMYAGELEMKLAEAMPMLAIANYYDIEGLRQSVLDVVMGAENRDKLVMFVQQCFDHELVEELRVLEPLLVKYVEANPTEKTCKELSDAVDVATFGRVLAGTKLANEKKIKMIREFLGDWNPSDEEKQALAACLVMEVGLGKLIGEADRKWLPSDFVDRLPK